MIDADVIGYLAVVAARGVDRPSVLHDDRLPPTLPDWLTISIGLMAAHCLINSGRVGSSSVGAATSHPRPEG